MLDRILLISNLSVTLIMFSAIWFVQLAYYPLLKFVGRKEFARYETEYVKRIMPFAILMLLLELITGILLLWIRPVNVSFINVLIGVLLLAIIWMSTFLIQLPLHKKLRRGFNKNTHDLILKTNWIRTIAWTLRAILMIWVVAW